MGATISHSSYNLVASKMPGHPNEGSWNSRLTDVTTQPQETIGILRQEGANTYMYVQFGTGAINYAGVALKPGTGLTDPTTNAIIAPFQLTSLGATAAGYFSAVGVTIATVPSGGRYGWIAVKGYGTLPINDNTAGMAFGTPITPSSSSATFANCAAASAVGRVMEPTGVTLGTATMTAQGGQFCQFNFLKTYV